MTKTLCLLLVIAVLVTVVLCIARGIRLQYQCLSRLEKLIKERTSTHSR
ncbi:unnamed protein product [marine sediment metagenome]|uniref:Uncharacterized protein n=1 Tax=marine sediment metagenome TaxID=412755 RepID=X0V9I9_9ZZZZ